MSTHVVIMAGGIGSRFWPMSVPEYPKQFIDVLGLGRTLLQMTVDRLLPLCPIENIWIVTSEKYISIVHDQLPEMPAENILAEPEARNTAPCIAYASRKISKRDADARIVVTPSDALVLKTDEYRRVLKEALEFTYNHDAIVTIGIKPSRPETGYGYIQSTGEKVSGDIERVAAFKEKPSLETAQYYIESGSYYWNAGIFVWSVATIERSLRMFAPQIAGVMDRIEPSLYTADEQATLRQLFPTCDKISIDYAVMEKADNIHVIAADLGWSDLGTWGSLLQNAAHDVQGNAVIGTNIDLHNCEGCVVHVSDMDRVIVEGLKDCIVAVKDGRLLICRLSQEQHIKEYSA
ncbi:MAG: mannose-1-phosphate guanylyltransferase [Bacteroidales bacterium]|nr:mannose-1-phosphate guanylyltransferase [Bacteroidales bacterium]